MCGDELNIFFSAFQKYGGSFISFNELKNRADFVLVIGAKQENFLLTSTKTSTGINKKLKEQFFILMIIKLITILLYQI